MTIFGDPLAGASEILNRAGPTSWRISAARIPNGPNGFSFTRRRSRCSRRRSAPAMLASPAMSSPGDGGVRAVRHSCVGRKFPPPADSNRVLGARANPRRPFAAGRAPKRKPSPPTGRSGIRSPIQFGHAVMFGMGGTLVDGLRGRLVSDRSVLREGRGGDDRRNARSEAAACVEGGPATWRRFARLLNPVIVHETGLWSSTPAQERA